MRSTIYLADTITNAQRRFGSASAYVPITVIDREGRESTGFLTAPQIDAALARGADNPEDVARVLAARRLRGEIEQEADRSRWPRVAIAIFAAAFVVAVVLALLQ